MPPDPIPPAARELILKRIDSVGQLELLLLLRSRAGADVTPHDAASELRMDAAWTAVQLAELGARGLLQAGPGGYRYAPASPELAAAVDELQTAYAQRRVAVITLIFSRPADELRAFSDAFRLGKKPQGKEPTGG